MLIPVLLTGQNEPNTKIDLPKKNIYGELHVGLFSQGVINYERQIFSGKTVSWYGRLGGGYGGWLEPFSADYGWGGLGAITMLTGKKNNHFELNAGGFLGIEKTTRYNSSYYQQLYNVPQREVSYYPFVFPIFNVGYRYQKPEGGFIFRANAGIISLGLSFGYAF